MAAKDITSRKDIEEPWDAIDALNHAHSMLTFLQDVLTLHPTDKTLPEGVTTTGLYYILQDIKDRVLDSNMILEQQLKETKEIRRVIRLSRG